MTEDVTGKAAGGIARALALTGEERKAISKKGVVAKQEKAALPKAICGDDAKPIVIGDLELQCCVLEDETRVLSLRGLQGSIGLSEGGGKEGARKIPALMARLKEKGLEIMDLDARANSPIRFVTMNGTIADGYDATILPDICAVLIEADRKGLLDKRLFKLGDRAALLQHGFATLGIIGLVDKVTGFNDYKNATEFSRLVEAYVAKALQPYVRKFGPDYYAEICRLRGLPFDPSSVKRPAYFGHLTNDIVYRRMAPGIWKELKARASKEDRKSRPHLHRYLTLDIGDPRLREVITKVVTIMQLSVDWFDFKNKLDRLLPAFNETMQLPLQLRTDDGKGL
jgi:P63C domain